MKLIIVWFLMIAWNLAQAQSPKEYVCTPCGNSCDADVYKKPGTCPACHMQLIEKSGIKFINISPNEMCDRISANPDIVLLDVRSSGEFKGTGFRTYGHFKKAININITELEDRLPELEKYKSSEIIVYCSHSQRSPRVSHLLTSKGFKNVRNMSGGVSTIESPSTSDCLKKYYVVH